VCGAGRERGCSRPEFSDLGGDSLSAIRLTERIEAAFGIEFPIDVLFLEGAYAAVAAECAARWFGQTTSVDAGGTADD